MDPYLLQINAAYREREFTADAEAERLARAARVAQDVTGRSDAGERSLRRLSGLLGIRPRVERVSPDRNPAR